MKIEKTYKVEKSHSRRATTIIEGTLEYLIGYFSYTLEIGNSWNYKISRNPKTIKSFVSNLQKSFEEQEACCYERTNIKKQLKYKDERVGHREARIMVLGWINIRKPKGAMPILCCTS